MCGRMKLSITNLVSCKALFQLTFHSTYQQMQNSKYRKTNITGIQKAGLQRDNSGASGVLGLGADLMIEGSVC